MVSFAVIGSMMVHVVVAQLLGMPFPVPVVAQLPNFSNVFTQLMTVITSAVLGLGALVFAANMVGQLKQPPVRWGVVIGDGVGIAVLVGLVFGAPALVRTIAGWLGYAVAG